MKKLIITVIAAIALFAASGCFNQAAEELMPPGTRIMGEVFEVSGNVITLNEVMPAGGGRVMVGGGGQQAGQVIIRGDDTEGEELDCEGEYDEISEDEYRVWERVEGEDGEYVFVARDQDGEIIATESRPVRIAGAEEGERIRGEGGVVIRGDGEGGAPSFRHTGTVREVTVPRNISVLAGEDSEETDISTLERGDIIVILYDDEGRPDSIRLIPNARVGQD